MTSAILHPHVILYSSIQDPVYSILLASSWDGGCWSVPRESARYLPLDVVTSLLGSQPAQRSPAQPLGSEAARPACPASPASPASQPDRPACPARSQNPENWTKRVSFFRIFCPRREDPRLVILLKSQKIGPLEKQVSFFKIFCPWREDPRLVIHLRSGSWGRDKGSF